MPADLPSGRERGGGQQITTPEQLREVVGEPVRRAVIKQRDRLDDVDRAFIARSPFQMIATAGGDGSVDVSPKGDPAGSVYIPDDHTLVLPDRPGQPPRGRVPQHPREPARRADLPRAAAHRHAARQRDRPHPARPAVRRGRCGTRVTSRGSSSRSRVEEVFTHCAKAFLRSGLWEPEKWPEDDLPSIAQMATRTTDDMTLAEMEEYYSEENTRSILYRATPP